MDLIGDGGSYLIGAVFRADVRQDSRPGSFCRFASGGNKRKQKEESNVELDNSPIGSGSAFNCVPLRSRINIM